MSLEHIGRKQSIGLVKESAAGTDPGGTTIWLPKVDGGFSPENTTAKDEGAYGVIDDLRSQETVKTISNIDFSLDIRDVSFGHILNALFGQEYPCVAIPIPGSITGTFVEGETITESTSNATGTLRRADVGGTNKVLYIDTTGGSGTFTGTHLLTGGTSGATATGGTIESPSTVRSHLYRVKNSNAHPSYTFRAHDDVGDSKSVYCMLDTLDFEAVAGQFATVKTSWKGKKVQSDTGLSPSFSKQNAFLAKYAKFYAASAFTGLDAATATDIKSLKLSFKKNLTDYPKWGDTDVAGFFNRQFEVTGQVVLIYNANTFRDYVTNSTKQAFRVTLANTDVTIGSAAHPTLQFDIPVASFSKWTRSTNNNDLVEQTIDFQAEYDITTALTIQAILENTQVTAY
jgi:hypothetical protein